MEAEASSEEGRNTHFIVVRGAQSGRGKATPGEQRAPVRAGGAGEEEGHVAVGVGRGSRRVDLSLSGPAQKGRVAEGARRPPTPLRRNRPQQTTDDPLSSSLCERLSITPP
jgi:hypothetical protein